MIQSGRDRAPADLKKEIIQQDRAEVRAVEKKIAPDRITEPRCNVCQHAFRDWIELMLVKGMAYKTISDRVTPPVGRQSLSTHHKKHMDLQDFAIRQLIESEAELQGRINEEGVADIVTKRAVLEVALRKGFDDVVNGITTVEPRDLIQIAKLLAEMDSHQYEVGLDELRSQVQLFIQAIKDVCDQDTQEAIGRRVKELRQREGISAIMEADMNAPVVTVGEIEEVTEATVVKERI